MFSNYQLYRKSLADLPEGKLLINTLNAHSYNAGLQNRIFQNALLASDVLLPDGIGVVWAEAILHKRKIKKIAGEDIFNFEMQRLNNNNGSCFFLGSSPEVLGKMVARAKINFPKVKVATYSPPYKTEFSEADNKTMLERVNTFHPDVLFIGMTAPKQEIWAYQNFDQLQATRVISIGAVFDFFARTNKRAPKFLVSLNLEWLYRLVKEPKRMFIRYVLGIPLFFVNIYSSKLY